MRFADGDKFLMTLGKPMVITIFDGKDPSKKLGSTVIDGSAVSVVGSMTKVTQDVYSVSIDWKNINFGSEYKITKMSINMEFSKNGTEYAMEGLKLTNLAINNKPNGMNLDVRSRNGYEVAAPVGSSFECYSLGMFKNSDSMEREYRVGLTLPQVRLQAFGVKNGKFGPAWGCGNVFSIGLWVGLLLSFFFALICAWGFSMLANIQTMDRFDDPKGKPIHVPQTEG